MSDLALKHFHFHFVACSQRSKGYRIISLPHALFGGQTRDAIGCIRSEYYSHRRPFPTPNQEFPSCLGYRVETGAGRWLGG
jgi:hypothetical protein